MDGAGVVQYVNQAWSESCSFQDIIPWCTTKVGENLLNGICREATHGYSFSASVSETAKRILAGEQDHAEVKIRSTEGIIDEPVHIRLIALPLQPVCLLLAIQNSNQTLAINANAFQTNREFQAKPGIDDYPEVLAIKDGSVELDSQQLAGLEVAASRRLNLAEQEHISRDASATQLRRRWDELAAIHQITTASVTSTSSDELIARTTNIIAGMLYPDNIGVLLVDKDEGVLRVHPSYWGVQPGLYKTILPIGSGSICGIVAASGESMLLRDVDDHTHYFRAVEQMRSEACVPLKIGEKVIGVLNAECAQVNRFLDADLRLLESVAGQLASGIGRLRTEQHERKQRLIAESLIELTAVINSRLNTTEILDTILEQVIKLVPYDAANIMLFENGQAQIVRQRGYERFGISEWIQNIVLEVSNNQKIVDIIQTGQPVLTVDTRKSKSWLRYPELDWVNSQICLPIIKNGSVVGIINLDHSVPGFFTTEYIDYLRAFADHTAIALNNSALFEDSQRRLGELEAVNKISSALRTARTMDEMLPRLLAEALDALGTDAGSITLYHPETGSLRAAVTSGWFKQLDSRDALEGEGIAWHVFKTGKPYSSEDFSVDALTFSISRPMIPPGWGGVGIPIQTTAEIVGVLFAAVEQPRRIKESEVRLLNTLSEIAGNAIHRSRLHKQTEQRLNRLMALRSVDAAISSSLDLRFTLSVLLDRVISHLDVDAADVHLFNPITQLLEYASGQGFRSTAITKSRLRLGEGTVGKSALERRSVIVQSILEANPGFVRATLLASEGFSSYACVPLIAKGQIKGVMEVFTRTYLDPDPEWIDFLETLGGQAAIAIDNSNLFNQLQKSNLELTLAYDTTLEGWARALELRDRETEGHSRRVTEMTMALARAMCLDESELVHIRRGALLHDIGKMGIPDKILSKKGPLSEPEWEIMRQHPVLAYEWLSPIAHLKHALSIPYCHHEKWDGSGYPRGLAGGQIPLAARIFAIVDVWDALLSDRPYRPAWPVEKVRQYLADQTGIHFDPQIVEHFLTIWQPDTGPEERFSTCGP